MFCNQCGRQNGTNARFCVYCGARLDVENAYPQNAGFQNNQPNNLSMYQDDTFTKPKQGNIRIFFQTFNLLLGAVVFMLAYLLTKLVTDVSTLSITAENFQLSGLLSQVLPADIFAKVTDILAKALNAALPYIFNYGMYGAAGLGLIGFIFSVSGDSSTAWGGARFYRFLLGFLNLALLLISLFFVLKNLGVLGFLGLNF